MLQSAHLLIPHHEVALPVEIFSNERFQMCHCLSASISPTSTLPALTVAFALWQCGHSLPLFLLMCFENTKTPPHDGQRIAALLPYSSKMFGSLKAVLPSQRVALGPELGR